MACHGLRCSSWPLDGAGPSDGAGRDVRRGQGARWQAQGRRKAAAAAALVVSLMRGDQGGGRPARHTHFASETLSCRAIDAGRRAVGLGLTQSPETVRVARHQPSAAAKDAGPLAVDGPGLVQVIHHKPRRRSRSGLEHAGQWDSRPPARCGDQLRLACMGQCPATEAFLHRPA